MKFLRAFVMVMLVFFPALSWADSYEEKFSAFWRSIEKVAAPISWSSEYKLQDVEFVRDEMFGDETIYARAWYSDYYVLIRKYKNDDWASSYVSDFWTNSEELTFAEGIKVGSSFSKVESYFGKDHLLSNGAGIYRAFQFEESDGGGVLMFSAENGRVTSIGCNVLENQTPRMSFLFNLYSMLQVGEVTGEKVNVREHAPYGDVKFQVSRSKGDRLLVYGGDDDGWYLVAGRITDNKITEVPYYSVSKKFVSARKLTPSERDSLISQYRK